MYAGRGLGREFDSLHLHHTRADLLGNLGVCFFGVQQAFFVYSPGPGNSVGLPAGMVESVDTSDLKSLGAIRTGSSPVLGTKEIDFDKTTTTFVVLKLLLMLVDYEGVI
jgi:hypothetical protein